MADTTTANISLTKPELSASDNTWGVKLNADLDTLDAQFPSGGTGATGRTLMAAASASAARSTLGVGSTVSTSAGGLSGSPTVRTFRDPLTRMQIVSVRGYTCNAVSVVLEDWPLPFAEVPAVTVTAVAATTSSLTGRVYSVSASQFSLILTDENDALAAGSVHMHAIGLY